MSSTTMHRCGLQIALAAAVLVTACGGGSGDAAVPAQPSSPATPSLTVTADAASAMPDGMPIGLHAVVQGIPLTPSWEIVSGPGSLSALVGADVNYLPPSAEAFDEGSTITISVRVPGLPVRTLTIALGAVHHSGHHWTTFKVSAVQWSGVANGGGLYVALGDQGRLSTSPDGRVWTARNTGSNDWFTAAARGDHGWVVIGGNHSLLQSADGIIWSEVPRKEGDARPNGSTNLVFGNGRFVSAGLFGSWVASDPADWRATSEPLVSVAFGNGAFVAVTNDDHLVRSTDGATWTRVRDKTVSPSRRLHAVAFTNGVFAVNDGTAVMASADGVTWSTPVGRDLGALYGTQDTFFATCASTLFGEELCYSRDATRFDGLSPNNPIDPFAGIAGDATTWVRASNYGSLEWNPHSSGRWQIAVEGSIGDLTAIDYAHGRYVAMSSTGWAISSADGQTWDTTYASPYSTQPGETFSALTLAHRGDVLVSAGGRAKADQLAAGEFVVSEDGGLSWNIAAEVPAPVRAVIDDGQRFVAVGDAGAIYTSPDGHAWSLSASLPNLRTLSSVAYGLGRYVAVGPKGTLATSSDGVAWTVVAPAAGDAALDFGTVIFDGQRFVRVAGEAGIVQTSTDGNMWDPQPQLSIWPANGLVFHDGEYVLLHAAGALSTSRDLRTWAPRTRSYDNDLRAVAFCNGRFMAAGANALILVANP